jgi:hypothetical protein
MQQWKAAPSGPYLLSTVMNLGVRSANALWTAQPQSALSRGFR